MKTARHPEYQYLDLMRDVWDNGDISIDRTGVGTKSTFGAQLRFSLADEAIPLLTTKKVSWKTAAREMLWFLTGNTNIAPLVAQGVHIWTDWPLDKYRKATSEHISRDEFEARILGSEEFAMKWGDLGPVYGAQWTNWPTYRPLEDGSGLFRRDDKGINQVDQVINGLVNNPGGRRHIITAWNVAELDRQALPACHTSYQFKVVGDRLSAMLWQRSLDVFLGGAYNVFNLALLTRMIAEQTGYRAHEVIWATGDTHIYLNHEEAVKEQLTRTPSGTPKLRIKRKPNSIYDYKIEDFEVYDYEPQAHIPAPVAV